MLIDQCYCSFTNALIVNWDDCGLGAYFDSSIVSDYEKNQNATESYIVIEELGGAAVPFDQNCDAVTDQITNTFTLHCVNEKDKALQFGKKLRSILNTKFKRVATDCGTIKRIVAGRPQVVRIGCQFMMRMQFNVFYITGHTF